MKPLPFHYIYIEPAMQPRRSIFYHVDCNFFSHNQTKCALPKYSWKLLLKKTTTSYIFPTTYHSIAPICRHSRSFTLLCPPYEL